MVSSPSTFLAGFLALTTAACGGSSKAPQTAPGRALASDAGVARATPLFQGTGTWTRPSTSDVPEAQRYFDQGLAFLFAFNHDEAIRSFTRAAELDPSCAMAHWGIAIANGPHINNPEVDEAHARAAFEAARVADQLAEATRAVDRALIAAAKARYAFPQPADRTKLDQAYAAAMRDVHHRYPDDADVGALFAESLMDLRPWDLWKADGKPQEGTEEIVSTLEAVLARAPAHPLANHLYIHAVEASAAPEKADAAADRLRALAPGLGHMVHMPSHVDVRRGRWLDAVVSNEKAIEADRRYLELAQPPSFYTVYMAHNHHMLAYAAMMVGQSERAIRAASGMIETIPREVVADPEMGAFLDGSFSMPLEVLVRFGRWEEILAAEPIKPRFVISRALQHQARGIAFAAQGKLAEVRNEAKAFQEAKARVASGAKFGNNGAHALLSVAEHMLAGEILARSGDMVRAVTELEEAVRREDALQYDEPPDWILPVRHALGAVLLKAKRHAEAERVYREDQRRLPGNGWSLMGLVRSLKAQGKAKEAGEVERSFEKAWANADVTLSSSCFCQPGG